ncbi:TATA box binding protein [Indivirus ILV1]|uniref:TATA box binding protein n=1 Tax=Indivirus ILV1 TaxID=1977633 RepID=A0A1V0SCF7_9VIRU|nr:TATA box binding protein [Indivirus ILV1]
MIQSGTYVDLKKNQSHVITTKFNSKNGFNLEKLPDDLNISTMTITCNLDTLIDIQNVGKYMALAYGQVVCVKYGPNNSIVRSLIKLKKKKKTTKKNRKNFYNQATVIIDVDSNRRVNIKVFKNGAIQMTGCKSYENFTTSMKILCDALKRKKAVYDKISKKIIPKNFISNYDKVNVDNIYNVRIRMINSDFDIGFLVNRKKLHEILTTKGVKNTFEPSIHAGTIIKYNYDDKDIISIFVFESGSIIITGAKKREHLVEAYKYITTQLYENYDKIVKTDVNDFLERDDIQKIIQNSTLLKSH